MVFLKIDNNNKMYFTPYRFSNHIYLFNYQNGKEIKKFGTKEPSELEGEFQTPFGITVNEKYLYVCDCLAQRVQIVDKENGKFISQWKEGGQRPLYYPQGILLFDEKLYIGDDHGIQIFTKDGKYIQDFGIFGSSQGHFRESRDLCIVNDSVYIVDWGNCRIQVWN